MQGRRSPRREKGNTAEKEDTQGEECIEGGLPGWEKGKTAEQEDTQGGRKRRLQRRRTPTEERGYAWSGRRHSGRTN